jgi:hypothetical protein
LGRIHKIHLVEEPESELITQVEVRPANEYDADAALGLIRRQQETVGLLPEELLCDGAYGSADVRADLGKLGVEVVAKMRPLTDSKHFVGKDEFEIDLEANGGEGSVTCPAGVTTTDFRMARDGWYRPVKLFRFPKGGSVRVDVTFVTQKRVAFTTALAISPARRMPTSEAKRALQTGGVSAYTSSSVRALAKEEDAWCREREETVNHENGSKG